MLVIKFLFFTILLRMSPSVKVPLKKFFFPTTNKHLVPVLFSFKIAFSKEEFFVY